MNHYDLFKSWHQLMTQTTDMACNKKIKSEAPVEPLGALASWVDLGTRLSHLTWARFSEDAWEYSIDFWQRCVLFMDTMRRRGNTMLEHYQQGMPPLLDYEFEVVLDARKFPRPVNYSLLYIRHPEGKEPKPGKRPILVIDPRAGHGPGIGGFKKDSEVGMGLAEGHPVYFASFTPEPLPDQTMEDVEQAEIR
ncbi:MAG: DUF3141 domain-containing protein, partial [Smithella sp.]|nr:DUF3141 domain-containing protein [Smithella sp.]